MLPEKSMFLIWYAGVVAFVFGCIWGSFFNVCIYRIPARRSIVRPGSHCYSCGTFLRWYDNIPILSYLLLRGNCRYCGHHFSPRYMGVELLSGIVFLSIYLQFGLDSIVISHCAFAGFLIVGTFTDVDCYILPDGVTIGGMFFAMLAAVLWGRHSIAGNEYMLARDIYTSLISATARVIAQPSRLTVLLWSIASAGAGWALLAGIGFIGRILFRKEAMGGGDIKLFAFLGAYLGAVNCLWVLFLSAVLGSCVGLTLILVHKLFRKDEYEEIELNPPPSVRDHIAGAKDMIGLQGERDTMLVGQSMITGAIAMEEAGTEDAPPDAHGQVVLRIARSTSRQLHHFPFGPYIAVAAFLVMFFHDAVNSATREILFLPRWYSELEFVK